MFKNMKKYILRLFAIVFCLPLVMNCAKPGEEYLHEDNRISSIFIVPANATVSAIVNGVIAPVPGKEDAYTIDFPVPRKLKSSFDLTKLKVKATVGYDVKITPSLSGIKDLSEPYEISVEATQTGKVRKYTLQAYYERN